MLSFFKKLFAPKVDLGKILKDGAVVLDVRTKNEFDAGHIGLAKHIPLDNLSRHVDQLKKLNKPCIVVCRSGSRSAIAKRMLLKAGIETYNGGCWFIFKSKYGLN